MTSEKQRSEKNRLLQANKPVSPHLISERSEVFKCQTELNLGLTNDCTEESYWSQYTWASGSRENTGIPWCHTAPLLLFAAYRSHQTKSFICLGVCYPLY
ncbi:hypothetical protein AOLI_G00023960 [Acnodon oligacanthus]